MEVVTIAAADVAPERADALRAAYEALVAGGLPDGIVETSLLRGEGDEWMVVTRWRNRAALNNMRASGEPPAAIVLFRDAGARPRVGVYDVVVAAR